MSPITYSTAAAMPAWSRTLFVTGPRHQAWHRISARLVASTYPWQPPVPPARLRLRARAEPEAKGRHRGGAHQGVFGGGWSAGLVLVTFAAGVANLL